MFRTAEREIRTQRGEPRLPGGERHRRGDTEGARGRAADAAPLGGAARGVCAARVPRTNSTCRGQLIQFIGKLTPR